MTEMEKTVLRQQLEVMMATSLGAKPPPSSASISPAPERLSTDLQLLRNAHMASVRFQEQMQQTLKGCLLACEKCDEDEKRKRAAFKNAERRQQGSNSVTRPSFFNGKTSPSRYTADSGTGSIAIQDAPSSSTRRKNAVTPTPAIHALVQMKGKAGNTKMDAKTEEAPLLFDPSMLIILRDTAVMLLVVALKAILYSVIGVGLVYAISLVAAESELESTPLSAATNDNSGSNFTFVGNSTFFGNSTLGTEGGLPLTPTSLHMPTNISNTSTC
jgi:hypothetical protein